MEAHPIHTAQFEALFRWAEERFSKISVEGRRSAIAEVTPS